MIILLMALIAAWLGYTTAAYILVGIWCALMCMGVGMYIADKVNV